MKKTSRILLSIIEVIIVVFVVSITLLLMCRNRYGFTQFGNKTFINIDHSMKDTVKNANYGDLVVVKSGEKIKKKDVLYYYIIDNESYIVSSGVVKESKDKIILEDDSVVDNNKIIGRSSVTIPVLGKIIMFIETKLGFVLCVLLPIILIFVYELYQFVSSINKDKSNNK